MQAWLVNAALASLMHIKSMRLKDAYVSKCSQLQVIMTEEYLPVQLQCPIPIFLSIEGIAFLFKPSHSLIICCSCSSPCSLLGDSMASCCWGGSVLGCSAGQELGCLLPDLVVPGLHSHQSLSSTSSMIHDCEFGCMNRSALLAIPKSVHTSNSIATLCKCLCGIFVYMWLSS